jgi:hypothetical protein
MSEIIIIIIFIEQAIAVVKPGIIEPYLEHTVPAQSM